MPVQIHLNGQRYFADDGTDPAELQQYAQMHQQEQAQLNPINQGMQNVFSGINRQIQNYNELPAPTAVPGNTYGMSTQAFNQTAGIIQQDNMNSATARMQQRVQMEQAMEQEKDRAQQIKVQDMQFKNQQKLEKMRQDQEEARLKREAEIGSVTNVSGVGPVHSGMKNGVPFASAVPIANAPAMQPEYVKSGTETVMENGVAVIKDIYVNKFDPKDTVAVNYGEAPPKSTATRSGWRMLPDGTQVYGELTEGMTQPAEQSKPLTPIQLMDVQKKAIELVRLRNGAWIDNDRMSENYGQVKPEFVNAFNAEVARELQAATGGVAPSVAPAPAQGGGAPAAPQTPQATIKIGDTYTGDDGKQYRYVGGNKGELVEQATQGFDPFANPGVYTPPQPAAPKFDMMNTIAAQNTGASPTAANILQAVQSQDAAADAAAKARAQELHAKLSKLTPRVINAALSQEPPSVQSWYRAINSAAMGQVGSNNPEQVTQGFRPVTPVSTLR